MTIGLIPMMLCNACTQKQAATENNPNIVFILADDLGYFDLSWRNNPDFAEHSRKWIETPNIDALAENGMVFTQHYSGCAVSAPSRASLLTGLHTGHTTIRGNMEYHSVNPDFAKKYPFLLGEGQVPIPAETDNIFKFLRESDYTTGVFGKWGLGYPGSEGSPEHQGVDEFFGYNCQRMAHNYYPPYLWKSSGNDVEVVKYDNNAWDMKDYTEKDLTGRYGTNERRGSGTYAPYAIHEKALEFIDNQAGTNPFFCYYATPLPHAELIVPQDRIDKVIERGGYEELGDGKYESQSGKMSDGYYASQGYPTAAYIAMVELLDEQVGEIVSKLKEKKIYDNTIIIFASDNGAHNEGGHDPEQFKADSPLKGNKRLLYEGGMRVPFIVQWPDKIKKSSTTDHPSTFYDFYATIADILGRDITEKNQDGISYLPTLVGNDKKQVKHDYLYWEFHQDRAMNGKPGLVRVAAREGNGLYKIVYDPVKGGFDENRELYLLNPDGSGENSQATDIPQNRQDGLIDFVKKAHIEDKNYTIY